MSFPKPTNYQREIIYSLVTMAIFAGIATITFSNWGLRPYTQVYDDFGDFGLAYALCSLLLIFLVHDTYFYWTHRMMHSRWGMKYVHHIHHKSNNPSPWAAFSFHPWEAIIEAGILILVVFLLPLHVFTISVFFFSMTFYNVYGHLGWELYPKGFHKTWIGKWINTSVSHNQHHQQAKSNYGLYFTFWDRIMRTMTKNYEEAFDKATSNQP
ncbi:MAG: sterol desaturase family protein [Cyclobacteriaceae bacterium]|nr:sterol desaturase family protein [Cyclobacteriaceae bacterium HetDA_MAG_MS6]